MLYPFPPPDAVESLVGEVPHPAFAEAWREMPKWKKFFKIKQVNF